MDTVTILIIIGVACLVFKAISWVLICRNASEESERYRARQLARIGRGSRRASAIALLTNESSAVTKRSPLAAPIIIPMMNMETQPDTQTDTQADPLTEEAQTDAQAEDAEGGESTAKTQSPAEENAASSTNASRSSPSAAAVAVPAAAVAAGGLAAASTKADKPGTPPNDDLPPPTKVTPAPDFDDYKAMKKTSPAVKESHPSSPLPSPSPTPVRMHPPSGPSPSTPNQITLQQMRAGRHHQAQEGLDF